MVHSGWRFITFSVYFTSPLFVMGMMIPNKTLWLCKGFFEDFNLVSSPFLSYISNPSIVRICHFKHVFSCPKYQTLIFSSYSLDSGYEDMNRQTLTLLRGRQNTNLSILLWMFYVLFMYCIIVYVYMLNWNKWMNIWMSEWMKWLNE